MGRYGASAHIDRCAVREDAHLKLSASLLGPGFRGDHQDQSCRKRVKLFYMCNLHGGMAAAIILETGHAASVVQPIADRFDL